MKQCETSDIEALLAEIQVYLRVVDAFRREGAEPCWASDRSPDSCKRRKQ